MAVIVILILLFAITEQKLANSPLHLLENHLYLQSDTKVQIVEQKQNGVENLWIMEVTDELRNLHIRPGTEEEDEDFEDVIGPMRKRLLARPRLARPPAGPSASAEDQRRALLRALNKHTISLHVDPEGELNDPFSDEDTSTTITIFTKGNLTLVELQSSEQAWRYAVPPPPLVAPPAAPLMTELYAVLLQILTTFSYLPM